MITKQDVLYTPLYNGIKSDKNLNFSQKVILCEIISLVRNRNKVTASNEYLSNMFGLSKRQISRDLQRLEELGYIVRQLDPKQKRKAKRIITLGECMKPYSKPELLLLHTPISSIKYGKVKDAF